MYGKKINEKNCCSMPKLIHDLGVSSTQKENTKFSEMEVKA